MPERCVVDTDVLSYYLANDPRAERYDRHLAGATAFISFMTAAELKRWVLARAWGARRQERLDAYLAQFTVVPADGALCRLWAEVSHHASRSGRPIRVADAWIAATALALDIPLVTHTRGDYAGVDGLEIVTERAP